jgi:hypothetical protein
MKERPFVKPTSLSDGVRFRARAAAALLGVGALVAPAFAQSDPCLEWWEGPLQTLPVGMTFEAGAKGIEPKVNCLAQWDHDNSPSTPNRVVVAGTFDTIGGKPFQHIAAWDGERWLALGQGLHSMAGATSVVTRLMVADGQIYAAGFFDASGSTPLTSIARFDGTSWQPVGALTTPTGCRAVGRLGSSIVVAAQNGEIRRWNGFTWIVIGSVSLPQSVNDLLEYNGELYACGNFTSLGGGTHTGIARWNGFFWSGVSGGLTVGGQPATAFRMTIDPVTNRLIVVGTFDAAGGQPAEFIAAWNGSTWSSLGADFPFANGLAECCWTPDPKRQLVVSRVGTLPSNLFAYNATGRGATWAPIDGTFSSNVFAVAYNESLASAVGGSPLMVGGFFETVDGREVRCLAQQDTQPDSEATWIGFRGSIPSRAVASVAGVRYGGGDWVVETPSGTANHILELDGFTSRPLVGPSGEGTNGPVHAIYARAVPGATEVFVGGDFTQAGGVAANRIAKFTLPDGANVGTWSAMGSGFNGTVLSIALHNSEIYASGQFTSSGGAPRDHVARWNGSSWQALALGLNDDVNAIASFGGQLYATGTFTKSGLFGTDVLRVARWNGSSWQSLTSAGINGPGHCLTTDGVVLIVGGSFSSASGIAGTAAIAGWSGSAWFAVPGGIGGSVHAMSIDGLALWAGGSITLDGATNVGVARFKSGDWKGLAEFAGDVGDPNDLVRAISADADDVHVLGDFTRISQVPVLDIPSWGVLSLGVGCCVGDVDGSGAVDAADLAALLGLWGPVPPGTLADLNGDLFVDAADLAAMLGGWGLCP